LGKELKLTFSIPHVHLTLLLLLLLLLLLHPCYHHL
jgi:hypothetical protein